MENFYEQLLINPAFYSVALLGVFAFGCCIGSFLNVCVWRVPRGESIVSPPSHCPKCDHEIPFYENIPIISYLLLRGKCSSCGLAISPRYLVLEVLTGVGYSLFFVFTVHTGLFLKGNGLFLLQFAWLFPLLICCAMTDCELGIIPDEFTFFGMGVALIAPLLFPERLFNFLFALFSMMIMGGLLALCAMVGKKIFQREALGWGDVKMTAMISAFTGIAGGLFTVLAGSLLGLLFHPLVCRLKKKKSRSLRFGPYLAFGCFIWLFAGDFLLKFYFSLFQ